MNTSTKVILRVINTEENIERCKFNSSQHIPYGNVFIIQKEIELSHNELNFLHPFSFIIIDGFYFCVLDFILDTDNLIYIMNGVLVKNTLYTPLTQNDIDNLSYNGWYK